MEAFFKNGIPEGEGTMILPNTIQYYGFFKKGFIEGAGTLTIENVVHKGKYLKGIFQGEKVMTMDCYIHLVFENKNDKDNKNGKVSIYFPEGIVIKDCLFKQGKIINCRCKVIDDFNNHFFGKIKHI